MLLGKSVKVREKMPWLVGVERRILEDIKQHLGLEQIYNLITADTP